MSSNGPAITVRGLSKSFSISHQTRHTTMAEALVSRIRRPLARAPQETFWGLRDISFDINQGDVVGIVGRNGAGKSTLLKILSRITAPTTGQIDLYGRVGSLLEVGTGFHNELTGRENIFLNGQILGMRRKEIAKQFDAIVDFAGVEQFLDTPVKRYSSGMYVRLAFAVAAHLNPEILIVDEVLAVGDAEFQKKCLGKMQEVSTGQGRTVLFVSHNMAAVRQLCRTGLLLKQGRLALNGSAEEVVAAYLHTKSTPEFGGVVSPHGLELAGVRMREDASGIVTESPVFNRDYTLEIEIRAHKPLTDGAVVVRVHDDMGALVSTMCTPEESVDPFTFDGVVRTEFSLPDLRLLPAKYTASVYVFRPNDCTAYLEAEDALTFEVQPSIIKQGMWPYKREHGVVRVSGGARVATMTEEELSVATA